MVYLTILTILFAVLAIYAFISRQKIDTQVQQENAVLKEKNESLNKEYDDLFHKKLVYTTEVEKLKNQETNLIVSVGNWQDLETQSRAKVAAQEEELQRLKSTTEAAAAAQTDLTKQAFTSYCETLEQAYEQADIEHQNKINILETNIKSEQQKLNEITATRAAAQQALLKEQEVKENKDNYRLLPSSSDLEDIQALERVKRNLHKPRILSMLIWQTYWQPIAKNKFPIILQDKTKCGIYKITNLLDNKSYIGQSVDVYKRWNDHCKCGLGIDTPPGNKLYKAIQEDGLENFTFELLAECPKDELDSKEKYFIELYQAKEYGYNGTGGNK